MISSDKLNLKLTKMEEIILKELIKNRSLDTCNDFVIWADKCDLEPLAKKIAAAINYTRCCTELKCSGCKKPLNDGLCGSCCSDLASGNY